MAGRTRTAAVPAGDNLGVHEAIATCEEGDVVVVAAGGDTTVALAGEILIAALYRIPPIESPLKRPKIPII